MEKNYFEKFKYVTALGMYRKGDTTWAVDCFTNSLYQIDEKTKEIKFLENMEVNSQYTEAEYAFVEEYNGILFILPQNSYFLCVYDTNLKKLKKIELPCEKNGFGYGAVGGFVYQGNLFIFSCFEKYAPYKINLINLEVEEEENWRIELKKLSFSRSKYLLSRVVLENDQVIFGVYNTNMLMAYSLKNKKFNKIFNLKGDVRIAQIINSNVSEIYVSAIDSNRIYKVDFIDNLQESFCIDFWEKGNSVIAALLTEDVLYILPRLGCEIAKYNIAEKKLERFEWENKGFIKENWNEERYFFSGCIEEQKLFLYRYKQGGRISIDLDRGSTVFESLDKDKDKEGIEIFERDYLRQLKSNFINYSETMCPLKIYINQPFMISDVVIKEKNMIGKKIWDELMED